MTSIATILIPLIAVFLASRFALWKLAPERLAVHAAVAHGEPEGIPIRSRWLNAGFVRSTDGKWVSTAGKFVGIVAGDSLSDVGLPKGATFLADRLTERDHETLKAGDIVIVDDVARYSKIKLRLRRIESVHEGQANFYPSLSKSTHTSRACEKIKARVTHILP